MYVGNVRHHGRLGEEYMATLHYLCLFSINLNLFQNKKVTKEKGFHADGAPDFPWISCVPEETRPLLQGLGASEIPFDCRHLAGPAAQGASARHPHSRTLVAVPAASRPDRKSVG